jgi:hypothetical protein
MTMLVMTVSLRSDPMHLQLTGRRHLWAIDRDRSQDVPPVLLATLPLLTVRDVLASTPMTTITVAQGLLRVLAWLLVLVELLEAMTSTRRTSRRTMRCEFIDSFFFSRFLVLVAKGGEN